MRARWRASLMLLHRTNVDSTGEDRKTPAFRHFERHIPSIWYTGPGAFSRSRPTRVWSARRRDLGPRLPSRGRLDHLALRANPHPAHGVVLMGGRVGLRQPGRLRLLRRFPAARDTRLG